MAKKRYRILFDAPVTIIFVLLTIAAFFANIFLKDSLVPLLFTCRSLKAPTPEAAFNFKNAMDYVRLILHVFAYADLPSLLMNAVLLLLLGSILEERYGSLMLFLMIFIASLVSGVLTACAPQQPFSGSDSIVFMMIILLSLTALAKRTVQISWLLAFIVFIAYKVHGYTTSSITNVTAVLQENLSLFINLAGGICGSLAGFLIAPKKSRKAAAKTDWKAGSDDTTQLMTDPDLS
ncbi:MAG: rhomboid family intramembrane serine protease [Treponema sp.]|nr:rhomboid family intramembrane serine protease [Treponema sp.]